MPQPLHRILWHDSAAIAEACRSHAFVQGLASGTLDPEAFRSYVAQDAFFLRAFFSAYALTAARSGGNLAVARRLHDLMGGVLDELNLHQKYAEELGIDLAGVTPNPAARAYTDFLLRIAWAGEVGEVIAAMTPCMRLYAYLGQALAADARTDNPYKDWIVTYASDGFEALAAELESLLDEVATPGPGITETYLYAMKCELDFFSAFPAT